MSDFAVFWSLYPRKTAKIAAQKAWDKNHCDAIAERICTALKKQLPHWTDAKFIPHPATWLNAGRWDDELHVETRPSAPVREYVPPEARWQQSCAWRAMMNVWLLAVVRQRGGVSDDLLERLQTERDRLAAQCREAWGPSIPPQRDMDILSGMLRRLETLT
jgi:hypothetical protein